MVQATKRTGFAGGRVVGGVGGQCIRDDGVGRQLSEDGDSNQEVMMELGRSGQTGRCAS